MCMGHASHDYRSCHLWCGSRSSLVIPLVRALTSEPSCLSTSPRFRLLIIVEN
jgi:hypothetical protein